MAVIVKHGKKWQVRIRKKNHPPIYKTFISKHEASKWARESERDIEKGIYHNLDEAMRTSLAELLMRYVAEVTPRFISSGIKMNLKKLQISN